MGRDYQGEGHQQSPVPPGLHSRLLQQRGQTGGGYWSRWSVVWRRADRVLRTGPEVARRDERRAIQLSSRRALDLPQLERQFGRLVHREQESILLDSQLEDGPRRRTGISETWLSNSELV